MSSLTMTTAGRSFPGLVESSVQSPCQIHQPFAAGYTDVTKKEGMFLACTALTLV